ncbi:hypothetical protein CHAB381_0025 [Campylobacter hominis ATCC BAA-381]|uniref:Uncharacterized protein n=1 Tax=Campylobacter hominis (strain ATCC BAA-381 / DSM 21671 / CCUG 45161 / LMG 19568 / NCTC 13146 / CH001A) TaxID=360107 RepID=A7HZF6_CAMHC|nr:hypothetical protein CHAB381_0025 [Campylobacter hominis ATCC BAA-381]
MYLLANESKNLHLQIYKNFKKSLCFNRLSPVIQTKAIYKILKSRVLNF